MIKDRVKTEDIIEESTDAINMLKRLVSRLEVYTDQLERELALKIESQEDSNGK